MVAIMSFPLLSGSMLSKFCRAMLAAIVCVCLVGAGCAAADEFMNLLTAIEPAAGGIVAIVCLAAAPECALATAAYGTYKISVAAVEAAYKDWQTADASAQPGKLGALQAAVAVLEKDFQSLLAAGHVVNPTRQSAIIAIGDAVAGEITQLLGLIEQTKSAGGTTTALALVLHENWGGGADPQQSTNQAHHKKAKKRKLQPQTTAAQFKADLKAKLLTKTGDAQLDKVNAETAAKLK